ncbi:MAG: hypothetical protein KGQ67_16720, partial [Betaproteobacteria bacterium]|nr:hypothetical protein [Betaproteobacteria bacterium]
MGFAASLALQPAGVWRVGTAACALVGLAGLGHWAWSQAGAVAMPGFAAPSVALLILLLGLRSGWRARRARASQALQLRIDALGHGHLHGPDGADRLLPLAGHRN